MLPHVLVGKQHDLAAKMAHLGLSTYEAAQLIGVCIDDIRNCLTGNGRLIDVEPTARIQSWLGDATRRIAPSTTAPSLRWAPAVPSRGVFVEK